MNRAIAIVAVLVGCSSKPKVTNDMPDTPTTPSDGLIGDAVQNMPGQPGLGAHGLAFYHLQANSMTSIQTPSMNTQATGSMMIVGEGRGQLSAFELPTDNKGNSPYQQLGQNEVYHYYPTSGTALYDFPAMAGGSGHVVTTGTVAQDEITLAAVEIINATRVEEFEWTEVLNAPITSKQVTTTAPATLIAFWWGEADTQPNPQHATVQDGFTIIDYALDAGSLVQCAVAVKNVATPGTYDVTWTATPVQGAQLWLIAVQ
jgi:hypothetical protein